MPDFNILHKIRTVLQDREVDVVLLQDDDFRDLLLADTKGFIQAQQQENIPVVLVGCPSYTSIAPEGFNISLSELKQICPAF